MFGCVPNMIANWRIDRIGGANSISPRYLVERSKLAQVWGLGDALVNRYVSTTIHIQKTMLQNDTTSCPSLRIQYAHAISGSVLVALVRPSKWQHDRANRLAALVFSVAILPIVRTLIQAI
jgi:Na+-transporting NADH:ubiquinone oxidoreductase subunit NqrB